MALFKVGLALCGALSVYYIGLWALKAFCLVKLVNKPAIYYQRHA